MNQSSDVHADLYVIDNETREIVIFDLSPDNISGYNMRPLLNTRSHIIIELTCKYDKWLINTFDKIAEHIFWDYKNGEIKHTYKFERLIIN